MFPKKIQFQAHPRALQQAVEILPTPKGKQTKSSLKSNELRDKLLQLDIGKLQQWKMKANVLELLVPLAGEPQNTELQKRVLAISIASIENFRFATLSRLLPLLYTQREFILTINAHFAKHPPTDKDTAYWLGRYYKSFRQENPAKHIATLLIAENISLFHIQKHLAMLSASPLCVAISQEFYALWDKEKLANYSYKEMLHFMQSGFDVHVRQDVLVWILNRYANAPLDIQHLEKNSPIRELVEIASKLLHRALRTKLSPTIVEKIHIVEMDAQLQHWLHGSDLLYRYNWWRRWAHRVEKICIHKASGILCIYANNFVAVEMLSKNNADKVSLYNRIVFQQEIQPLLWQSVAFHVTIEGVSIQRTDGWEQIMDVWMQDMQQGHPLQWT